MIGQDEQDNRKIAITQNFLNALDYLLDSGRLKSIVEFERITGYRQQRISGMKKFLADYKEDPNHEGKRYYASTDHLAVMSEKFGVSLNYLLNGEKPIVVEKPKKENQSDNSEWKENIEQKIAMLNEKYMLLKERLDLYREKNKSD